MAGRELASILWRAALGNGRMTGWQLGALRDGRCAGSGALRGTLRAVHRAGTLRVAVDHPLIALAIEIVGKLHTFRPADLRRESDRGVGVVLLKGDRRHVHLHAVQIQPDLGRDGVHVIHDALPHGVGGVNVLGAACQKQGAGGQQ